MAELNENNDELKIENTKGGPSERVRKMKQKLEKMVLAMKQPDEDEIDEDIELSLLKSMKPLQRSMFRKRKRR